MKKLVKLAAIAALTLFSVAATAQIKIGANAAVGMPMGTLGDVYSAGFGGGLSAKYMLNDNMSVGAGFNYIKLGSDMEGVDFSTMPVTANFSYYFGTEGFKPYAGIDAGIFMNTFTMDLGIFGTAETASSDLGFAPVVGFEYAFSDALALDVNAKYNYIMTEGDASTILGINVGIVYSLGK